MNVWSNFRHEIPADQLENHNLNADYQKIIDWRTRNLQNYLSDPDLLHFNNYASDEHGNSFGPSSSNYVGSMAQDFDFVKRGDRDPEHRRRLAKWFGI